MLKHIRNEKGIIFIVATMLLFIVTSAVLIYLLGYKSQLNIYNALESKYVRATINILEEIGNYN